MWHSSWSTRFRQQTAKGAAGGCDFCRADDLNPRAGERIDMSLPVIHAKHISENPKSVFYRGAASSSFMAGLEPAPGERTLEKNQPSAFAGTDLVKTLDKLDSRTVVVAGFTAHECIDSTAKHAIALGLDVWVIEDGVAQFEVKGPSGKVFKASDVHEIVLSGLGASARLISARQLAGLADHAGA